MSKRIAYIGLSFPIRFDKTVETKSWLTNGAPILRFPYIESPWGMMLLFDELWFLCQDVCPVNMRNCSFVKFISEMYPQLDYQKLFYSTSYEKIKPDCHIMSSDEFYANYQSYPGSITTGPYADCYVGNMRLKGGVSSENYLFDLKVKQEVEQVSKRKLEMITNSHIRYENYLSQVKVLDFSNTLILNGVPNYIEQLGPYHPIIEEFRDSQYISDYRKWILSLTDHIQQHEIVEMKEAVEADLRTISEKLMLKYMNEHSQRQFYKSTAKTVINTAIGCFVAPYSVAVAAKDIWDSKKTAEEVEAERWSAFLIESRNKYSELMKRE